MCLYRAKGLLFFVVILAASFPAQNPRVPANFSLQVNGMVRYAANRQPAENVLVRLEAFSGGIAGQVTTDRTGKFSFTGLIPQQYVVTIHSPGFSDVRQTVDLLTQNTGYLNVELIADKDAIGAPKPERTGVINAPVPKDAESAFDKGKTLLYSGTAGSVPDAIKSLEHAVSIHPKYLEAEILLGLAYMDQRNWPKAEAALQEAVTINHQASTALFALGEVYFREKKFNEGVATIGEGLKLNPESAQGHFTLAKLYWDMAPASKDEQEFRAKAQDAWNEVNTTLKIDPNFADAHVLAGNMLLRARRANDALAHFETYLKLQPNGELAGETTSIVKKIQEGLRQQ